MGTVAEHELRLAGVAQRGFEQRHWIFLRPQRRTSRNTYKLGLTAAVLNVR
jgi:hypothetical protein